MNVETQNRTGRRKAVWGARVSIVVAFACVSAMTGCGQAVRQGEGNSYLILSSLLGASGGPIVQSDVVTATGGILPDTGLATFLLAMKDPQGPGPTDVNSITITQYHVEYVRSDGRNTPGVDVPFAFDGGLTQTVSAGGTSFSFTLVRIQAKEEAPLKAMKSGGGADVITTTARVTFYGHDQSGRGVSVTGNLEVSFADWAG
jgi:hypothetical protein